MREGSSHNACQRKLLPHLLVTSRLDLSLARSFACDFDLSEDDTIALWLKLVVMGDAQGEPRDYKQLTLSVLYRFPEARVRQVLAAHAFSAALR